MKCKQLIISSGQRADCVIYMSADMKQELLEHRFSEEKLAFIPNGVDIERYLPSLAPAHHSVLLAELKRRKVLFIF